MKLLIIGSEGFVGNNLVNALESKHDIICADLSPTSNHKNYQKIDINNFENVKNVVKDVDVVINLAAHTLTASLDQTLENAKVNIIGLLNILESCKKNKIKKIIFTSASSLVGEPTTFQVSEEHTTKPKTAYGITKLASEHYLRLYNELYGIDFVIFRFFNIYGPYQKNGLIPSLYNRLSTNQPLTIFGEGNQVRDYVFIEDVIEFFEKTITSNIGDNQIFNLGTGIGSTIKELIQALSEITKIEPVLKYESERPGEIGNFVADTTKLETIFKKLPSTNLKNGLTHTISWIKANTS
jgi:UDP-glucose 4-epimerase